MPIFNNARDYTRFLKTVLYYQIEGPKPKFSHYMPTVTPINSNQKIVDVVCFCLMPNHFHFLLLQKRKYGITEFVSKISNSYTKYFNTKNNRVGPLFQGEFKAVYIETEEQLLHVSRYIHLNPVVGFIVKDINEYRWSSYKEYIGEKNIDICSKGVVLSYFKKASDYVRFVHDQEDYGKRLEEIKHQLIDLEE